MTSVTLKWCGFRPTSRSAHLFLFMLLLPAFISVVLISLFSDFMPTLFGAYADQRFFQLGLLLVTTLAALLWVPQSYSGLKLLSDNWAALQVSAAFLVLAIPNSSGEHAWIEPGMYSLYFITFVVLGWQICEQLVSRPAAVMLVHVMAVACFFYAAMTITVYLFAIVDGFSTLTDIIPWGFVSMRYWSHIATWMLPTLPLALMYSTLNKSKFWRIGIGFTAGIWWWMIFMTTARGSMLSLALACAVVYVLYGRAVFPWLMISLRFIVFGGLAWLLLSLAIPSIVFEELAVRSLHVGSSGRMPLWFEAWHLSLQHFPFGMGPQSWITHEIITNNLPANSRLGHPHNMYLMWAAEYGWLLVAAIVVLLAATLRNLGIKARQVRAGAHEYPDVLIAFTASAVAGLVHAGFSAVFIVPASMLVGVLVLSVFWALSLQEPHRSETISKRGRHSGYPGAIQLALACAIAVGGVVLFKDVWGYHQAMAADLHQYEEGSNGAYWPRFWFHGNFPRSES